MVCCIDFSNIFFINWSMFLKNAKEKNGEDYLVKEEDLGLLYHMIIKRMMEYLSTYKEVVLCWEGKNSTAWRKKEWPPYKANRKHDDPNYQWVGVVMEKCFEFFNLFHTKCLKVENCEGDDCIYQVSKYYAEKGEEVRIISSDKDLSQIINYYPELVSQYNPVKKANVEANENILLEKAIVGDASDNIKAFKGIGPKTFEKMMSDKTMWAKKMTPQNMELLESVLKIVDLRKYPEQYQKSIVEELEKPWSEFNSKAIEKFFIDNRLKVCYDEWNHTWYSSIVALTIEQPDAMEELMDILGV